MNTSYIRKAKKDLRKELIEQRKQLPLSYRQAADVQITQNILDSDKYQTADTIFCFVSTTDEVDTHSIIEDALASGKCVTVPKCIEKGIMYGYQIKSFDDLESGKYGILEPKEYCRLIDPEEIDFAIIPCLSCDPDGYRLGYGGGYYDRYLQNTNFSTAAICYREMLGEELPVEEFDVKVDMIITD